MATDFVAADYYMTRQISLEVLVAAQGRSAA